MDLSYTPEQDRFREEVRTWIAEAMPVEMKQHAQDVANFEESEVMEWHKILYAKGWVASAAQTYRLRSSSLPTAVGSSRKVRFNSSAVSVSPMNRMKGSSSNDFEC